MASIFEQTSSLLLGLFDYNRENFSFDRRQRQIMEYQLLDKRIEQGGLWREDVRGMLGLVPEKMDVYLTVIALELALTMVALCKGRMPFGAPTWLVACHTLSILTATMYLFMALWFGMHAFVAAQAYKVRILTQLVRLPVPSWQQLEGARTYLSDFETTGRSQALRVPFVGGAQESRVPAAGAAGPPPAVDPWGLERRGDDVAELQLGVNTTDVHKQRHVWLMREACRFCHTYDAFCRISMSAGNCCLASFFCYYCLGYVACELAAPVGALVGMCAFGAIAVLLMRHDMLLSLQETLVSACLLASGEAICFVVVLACFSNGGDPGYVGYLMPIALASKATWLLYYLTLFRVTEHQTGTFLPAAFASVLYLDPFGWAKHGRRWWRRAPQSSAAPSRGAAAGSVASQAAARPGWLRPGPDAPPAAQCVDAAAPARPEDVGQAAQPQQRGVPNLPYDITARAVGTALPTAAPSSQEVPFRSHTFATSVQEKPHQVHASTGPDVHGERPGLTPWRMFFVNTVVVSAMWWCAAGVTLVNAVKGDNTFSGTYGEEGLSPPFVEGRKVPLLRQGPQIVLDSGAAGLGRLHGLACDPEGKLFATAAQGPEGRAALLLGRAAWGSAGDRGASVALRPAPACPALGDGGALDLSILGCGGGGECSALVLPHGAARLVACPLLTPALGNGTAASGGASEGTEAAAGIGLATRSSRAASAPLRRSWLEDRGGAAPPGAQDDGVPDGEGLLHPEDIASVSLAPCAATVPAAGPDCLVVGTTARRVVLMAMSRASDPGGAWAPKRVLWQGGLDVPGPGSLVALGRRHVGVLDRGAGLLRAFDLMDGGRAAGSWRLPASAGAGGRWAAVCAGGGRLFAMGEEESPSLAQFFLPPELLDGAGGAA